MEDRAVDRGAWAESLAGYAFFAHDLDSHSDGETALLSYLEPPRIVAPIDEWLANASGSYLLDAPPLSGPDAFLAHLGDVRSGELLLVSATRSSRRTAPSVEASATTFLDCAPGDGDGATEVGSPGDLTGISMPASEFLRANDAPTVGMDSVSTLLYYGDTPTVFRFLSVLTAHIRRNDGLGVFVFVSEAHSEQTVRTFEQVFDGRMGLHEDGQRIRIHARDAPAGWQPRRSDNG